MHLSVWLTSRYVNFCVLCLYSYHCMLVAPMYLYTVLVFLSVCIYIYICVCMCHQKYQCNACRFLSMYKGKDGIVVTL